MRALGQLLRLIVLSGFAIAIAWIGGLAWFGFTMPQAPATDRNRTDAIVVLTGGADRLNEGVRLLSRGYSKWLFVSGVNPDVRKPELMKVAGVEAPEVARFVVLGKRAVDTRGNATESATWLRARGFKTLRLVTANYHMRRSLLEFRRALPNARIVANPVFPKPVNPGPWWRNGRGLSIVAGEFNKYLFALVGPGARTSATTR